jgi:hypothetical protein
VLCPVPMVSVVPEADIRAVDRRSRDRLIWRLAPTVKSLAIRFIAHDLAVREFDLSRSVYNI